jgi:3-methyladenine DNA glycosylase AlkD
MDELMADVRKAIEDAAGTKSPQPDRRYHKHDQYLTYGLRFPDLNRVLKGSHPRFEKLDVEERLDLATRLLGEHIGELGHAGISIVAHGVDELRPKHFGALDSLFDDFRSWSQVDTLCEEVIKPLLLKYPEQMLELIERWNTSSSRWRRRASMVTFTRSIGESGEFTELVLSLCENLVWDPEDIVQKGVGWALKDNMRAAPDWVKEYVKDLRRRGVSSTITLYAIRDLKGEEREEMLRVKKGAG